MNDRENQTIIAIDPGTTQSAFMLMARGKIMSKDIVSNTRVRYWLGDTGRVDDNVCLTIEGMACQGMAVGKETFDTVMWIGRFIESWSRRGGKWGIIYRPDVKMHLCHSMRAKPPHIRQALIDRFGPGKRKAIGLKATPGPLYGVSSHLWSALAIAVTYADLGWTVSGEEWEARCPDSK